MNRKEFDKLWKCFIRAIISPEEFSNALFERAVGICLEGEDVATLLSPEQTKEQFDVIRNKIPE